MVTTKHILHTAKLANNCPECYGTAGLEFTFSQEMKENMLLKRPMKNIEEALICHHCNTTIYPISWTANIEGVYEYNQKLAEEKRLRPTVKPLFYLLVIVDLLIVAGLIYYFTK